jgi:hypothetical protein
MTDKPKLWGRVELSYDARNAPEAWCATLALDDEQAAAYGGLRPHSHSRAALSALVALDELLAWEAEDAEEDAAADVADA